MSEPAETADQAPAERLHPLVLVSGLGRSLRNVAGAYAGVGFLAATGKLRTALIVGAILLLGSIVALFIRWIKFSYRVGAHEIRIDSGFLSRTHRSIPFDRVQDVDITQGPLQRLFGVARVTFETGGAAARSTDDGALAGIPLARAQALREYVRARRGASAPAAVAMEEPAPLFAMTLSRVLLAGVFNFSLAIFAGLFGLSQTVGDVIGFDPFDRSFWINLLASTGPIGEFVKVHRIGSAIAGLILLIVVGTVTGVARTLTREFRFRLDRTGTGLRRRRGLFTLTDVTLPLRRVQAALILTGPVRERFGWRELKVQSLAADEGKGDHVVAPLARTDELEPILAEFGWQEALGEQSWEPVSRAYVTSFAVWLVVPALVAAVAAFFTPYALNTLFALTIVLGTRWLGWRRIRFAFTGERLLIRRGWWKRSTVILPLRSVQSVDLSENAIGRRFGIAALTVGVAGGSGFSGHSIPALPRERASQVRAALLSPFT